MSNNTFRPFQHERFRIDRATPIDNVSVLAEDFTHRAQRLPQTRSIVLAQPPRFRLTLVYTDAGGANRIAHLTLDEKTARALGRKIETFCTYADIHAATREATMGNKKTAPKPRKPKTKTGILPPTGCYLGWDGCTNTADVQTGNAWVCFNCEIVGRRGE